jgi:hypothetical protein
VGRRERREIRESEDLSGTYVLIPISGIGTFTKFFSSLIERRISKVLITLER